MSAEQDSAPRLTFNLHVKASAAKLVLPKGALRRRAIVRLAGLAAAGFFYTQAIPLAAIFVGENFRVAFRMLAN